MKKSDVTDEWQCAVMMVRVRVRPGKDGETEMIARGGRKRDAMYVTPAELCYLIPVAKWPTRKQIEGLVDATTT